MISYSYEGKVSIAVLIVNRCHLDRSGLILLVMFTALKHAFEFVLHIDRSLLALQASYGNTLYVILFAIVFCETGLVVTPFLPGDSLLFAAGALAGVGGLSVWPLLFSLIVAAIAGDSLNYTIGHKLGSRVMATNKLFGFSINPEHLTRAERFFREHGHRAIVLARFAPIIRTFVPFFAGMANMPRATFLRYNIAGGVVWVALFVLGGYFFGNLPIVKERFGLVVIAIIVISLLPMARELRRK